jgi:hypothetical protein
MMADGKAEQTGVAGSGPLYEHGEAGQKAAEEPVNVPGSADKSEISGSTTGEEQAAANRAVDPPA